MVALWITVGVLALIIVALTLKIIFMKRAAREIAQGFAEQLSDDTNTLITVSTGDRQMRALAVAINDQLKLLRRQRLQYLSGDRELRDAVTNISHDLRTPLTAICGYLNLLEKSEKSEDVARYLRHIEERVQAMKRLTEELFRYSVILSTAGSLEIEELCLNDVLGESLAAFYGALTQRGITPSVNIPEVPVIRKLNRGALDRVLENVLNNAVKYSTGDLEVTLTSAGELCFANLAPQLDKVQLGRLFDRFFSVESARNSTGLGLAIAKTLVEQMKGSISATLEGQMLRVYILFPEI